MSCNYSSIPPFLELSDCPSYVDLFQLLGRERVLLSDTAPRSARCYAGF
jgi:hypothetical protein